MQKLRFAIVAGFLIMALFSSLVRAVEKRGRFSVDNLGLLPLPRHVTAYATKWQLPAKIGITADNPAERHIARFLQHFLRHRQIVADIASTGIGQIMLSTGAVNSKLGHEGYLLDVTSHGAVLSANTGHGLFYALQTFEQLFNPAKPTDNAIHEVSIMDWPRYRWRGIMLDCARYRFSVRTIKKFIRLAAHYKLNMFHWHLSDFEGWRVKIPQYPKLTQIGAYWYKNGYGGGYYTQKQIREIVAYAHARYITIVPEIDVPGHCRAAIQAYPWLAGGRGHSPLTPSRRTFQFLKTVFGDLARLFPGPIHIGGDEVDVKAWAKDRAAHKLMRRYHWKSLQQILSYFEVKLARFLNARGHRAIIWDDPNVPVKPLPRNTIVECWNSSTVVPIDASEGHDIMVAEAPQLYFDARQGDIKYEPWPVPWYRVVNLRTTYQFNPSELLPVSLRSRLLGAEACMWADEWAIHEIPKAFANPHLFYQLLPRELALAEICWTPKNLQNYSSFVSRTSPQYSWLRKHHYYFRMPQPSFRVFCDGGHTSRTHDLNHNALIVNTTSNFANVLVSDPVPETLFYYTLNGAIPDVQSVRYRSPLHLQIIPGKPVIVRVVAIDPFGRTSAPAKLILKFKNEAKP
jgi:hexosaminidase